MRIMSLVKNSIAIWWQGTYIHQEPPFIMGFYRRHWSAKAVSTVIDFYLRHWQWFWTSAIGIAALYVAPASSRPTRPVVLPRPVVVDVYPVTVQLLVPLFHVMVVLVPVQADPLHVCAASQRVVYIFWVPSGMAQEWITPRGP